VFPVGFELSFYILIIRYSVFKGLMFYFLLRPLLVSVFHVTGWKKIATLHFVFGVEYSCHM
jgi:hypothetical protein